MIWIDLEHKKPTDVNIPGWLPWSQEKWDGWLAESARLTVELAALQAADNVKGRNDLIDANSDHWGELKPWLEALSHGKCWFSETRDEFSHYDVEHFRPKKLVRDTLGSVRDGYWWLAFDYTNYRLCGNVGNRKKGNCFPLQRGSLLSSYEMRCEESEECYFLDPVKHYDVNLLAFDEEGKAIPAPKSSVWERIRVEETIKRLKFNEHEALTEARRRIWVTMTSLIEQFNTTKLRCNCGGNPAARQKLHDLALQIQEMTEHTAELSSVARWCIYLRNEAHLSRLVA